MCRHILEPPKVMEHIDTIPLLAKGSKREEDLKSGSKIPGISRARAVLCYVGARKLGFPSVSIAEELGISPSTVSRAILRGRKLLGQKDIEAILSENQ